ncbi:MAG: hypothetical protein AB7P03_06935 [Kofleriaceae bacterium]
MRKSSLGVAVLVSGAVAGCAEPVSPSGGAPVDGFGGKADGSGDFVTSWKIVNTLRDGETAIVEYTDAPRYRALQLRVAESDSLSFTIEATAGTPLAFLVDATGNLVASSDPGSSATIATLETAVLHTGVMYLAVREADLSPSTFTVTMLGGVPLRALDRRESLFAQYYRMHLHEPAGEWNPSTAAYEAIAVAAAYRRAVDGAGFAPELRAEYLEHLRYAATWLVDHMPAWQGVGWGGPAAWDAYQDGSLNPANTVYAYQTGTAILALAEAASLIGEPTPYRDAAVRAMNHYLATAYIAPPGCASCGYFVYSDHLNDRHRGVKNTNMEMALGGLVLDRYFPDPATRVAAVAAAEYHFTEIHDHENYSYLSVWDPSYFPTGGRWDVHNSIETWYLLRAGELLGRQDYIDAAIAHYNAYDPHAPNVWERNLMSCHFARYLASADQRCETFLVQHQSAASDKALGLVLAY